MEAEQIVEESTRLSVGAPWTASQVVHLPSEARTVDQISGTASGTSLPLLSEAPEQLVSQSQVARK